MGGRFVVGFDPARPVGSGAMKVFAWKDDAKRAKRGSSIFLCFQRIGIGCSIIFMMKPSFLLSLALPVACTVALLLPAAARAQSTPLAPELAEIVQAGRIIIGVREDALPFAFVDQDGVPKGYAVDICRHIAENVRRAVGLPELPVRYNTLTVTTRELLVREKVVDLECGATSITRARSEQFDFSLAYGVEQGQLISPAGQPVASLVGLQGTPVLVTRGSTTAQWLDAHPPGAGAVSVANAARAYFAMVDGKARAYAGSGEVFLGEVLRRGGQPADFHRVTLDGAAVEPLAVMMRKGRPALKKIADDTIRSLSSSGELTRLYARWFESPITVRRVALAQPMTPAWAAMVAAPTDQPAN